MPPSQLLFCALVSLFLGFSPLLVALTGPDIMIGIYIFFTAPVGVFIALYFLLLSILRMLDISQNKR